MDKISIVKDTSDLKQITKLYILYIERYAELSKEDRAIYRQFFKDLRVSMFTPVMSITDKSFPFDKHRSDSDG